MKRATYKAPTSARMRGALDKARKSLRATAAARARAAPTLRGRFSAGDGAERKFFDTALSFSIDATGEVPATGQLALIPQGVTESTRVGRKCVIKSIQFRGSVNFAPGAAANASTLAHILLVQDTQTNGAAAAVTDVMTSANLGLALRNMNNTERFRVLKHWTFKFVAQAGVTTAYNTDTQYWDYYGALDVPMEYSGTDGTIGTIRTNNLFLLAGTDSTTDDTVTVGATCRVRFTDGS